MSRTIRILFVALAAQLFLIAILFYTQTHDKDNASVDLVDTQILDADEIVLSDQEGSVILKREGINWYLPNYGNLETGKNKVEDFLKTLSDIKVNWPVASTKAAAERFEVTEGEAQKTLVISKDGKAIYSLYIGTSPGFRKLHVRKANDENIYAVEIPQQTLSAKASDWFNQEILKVSDEIVSIQTPQFTISKLDNAWTLDRATQAVDAEAIKRWAESFSKLQASALVDAKAVETITIQNPALTANLETSAGQIDIAFYTVNEKYYAKHFGDKRLFEIPSYLAKPLIDDATVEHFQLKKEEIENTKSE